MLALVFLACALLVGWTYLGYPLAIRLRARLAPRPTRRGEARPALAVVIVGHDEAERIGEKVADCLAQDYPAERLRVIVVDDGSTDAMLERAREAGGARIETVRFERRRGKAACLAEVVPTCPEEIVVLADVRQRLARDAVSRLVAALGDPTVGAVGGELVFELDRGNGFGEGLDAYWRYEKSIRRAEAAIHSSVGVSGALYAIRRSLFRPIPANTVLDDVLIPMQVVRAGYRVLFEEGAWAIDRPAESAERERVRKVRTIAGNFQLLAEQPWLLSPRANPLFVQFVSHKVLRLLTPVALAAMLLTSALLAPTHPAWAVVLAAQLAGWGLPALGQRLPALGARRIVRIATAFAALNACVVLGFVAFVRAGPMHLWPVTRMPPAPPGTRPR